MARYRQKPDIVDARQFIGGQENSEEIITWLQTNGCSAHWVDNQTVLDIHLVERLSFIEVKSSHRLVRSAYRKDWIVRKNDTWRIFPERKFLERFEAI